MMLLKQISALLLVCSAFRHEGDLQNERERHESFASSSEGEQTLENLGENLMWDSSFTHGYGRADVEWAAQTVNNCWHGASSQTSQCISHSFKAKWPEYKYTVLLSSDFFMTVAYFDQIVFEWYGYKIKIWSSKLCWACSWKAKSQKVLRSLCFSLSVCVKEATMRMEHISMGFRPLENYTRLKLLVDNPSNLTKRWESGYDPTILLVQ